MIYKLLYLYARFCFRLFYPNISIRNKENIPVGEAVIFVSNHQNSMIDPLAILFSVNRPVYFLARADIFNNKLVAFFLGWLKMIPVYRMRDGVDSMSNNEATFQRSSALLLNKQAICIFPEGVHSKYKSLQPLKKGFARIIFQAMEISENRSPLFVQPVGIDYSNYHKQGSDLVLIFGQTINAGKYYAHYQENPVVAVTELRNDLSTILKTLMIDVEYKKEYYFILNYAKWRVYNDFAGSASGSSKGLTIGEQAYKRFTMIKAVVDEMNNMLSNDPEQYAQLKSAHAFIPSTHEMQCRHTRSGNLLSRLAVRISDLLHFAPTGVARYFAKTVKDPQFESSVKYGASLLLFPLWYIMVFMITTAFTSWQTGLSLTITLIIILFIRLKYAAPKLLQGQQ